MDHLNMKAVGTISIQSWSSVLGTLKPRIQGRGVCGIQQKIQSNEDTSN